MINRPAVLITAPRAVQALDRYRAALAGSCELRVERAVAYLEASQLLPLVGDIDAIICGDDRLTAEVIAAAPRLRVIAKWGTGIDAIDVAEASRRGIRVCNTPGAFSEPLADTVLGYLLLFTRQLDVLDREVRDGRWERHQQRALGECTLGIVGLGHSGRAVARRAGACGMHLLACSLEPLHTAEQACLGVTQVPLDVLLAESDFVTLHVDLRPENHRLIDDRRLRLMKSGACLVNTARGALVDEIALVDALMNGRLRGAALDVFVDEPLPAGSRLRTLPNVYLAPHHANASVAAAERVHANTIRNVLQTLALLES